MRASKRPQPFAMQSIKANWPFWLARHTHTPLAVLKALCIDTHEVLKELKLEKLSFNKIKNKYVLAATPSSGIQFKIGIIF